MPVPHFNIKITQRSKGNSAVAGAAYQAGEKLFSEYDQKTKNYTCKKEVVYTEIMLPPNAPPEYRHCEAALVEQADSDLDRHGLKLSHALSAGTDVDVQGGCRHQDI